MPAEVKVVRARDFLQVASEGEVDFEASKELLAQIATSIPDSVECCNILIDFRRALWRLDTTDIFYLAAEAATQGPRFRHKIAVLVLPGSSFDQAEFFELCSNNRGLAVEAFTNYEDAIHWFFMPNNNNNSC